LYDIALISAGYPPYTFGGIDIQTYDLSHALASMGLNVTVFCGFAKRPTFTMETENLKIFRLPLYNIPPRVVWFQLKNVNFFKENLQNFDLVHTQHSSGSIYGLLKKKIGKPWVVSFHDHQLRRLSILFNSKPWNMSLGDIVYYGLGYPLFELLTKIELKYADRYIMCGLSGFQDYSRFSNIKNFKTAVIPNGINIEKIESASKRFEEKIGDSRENKGLTIFTCGRLYASKGIQYLIRAMHEVKDFPNVHLKIFGKGPLRPRLEQLIHDLGLTNHVTIEGHVPYEQLMYELKQSDLAVFPSLVEVGASLAVMEAMAFRKAVIAFRYSFTMEILEHLKTGYLAQPKNISELAKAISLLLGDKKLRDRLGNNAYLKVLTDHNWNNITKRYIQIYSQVISKK
jgi:glycosyltransferase involved in cell wall biosynthesis